MRARIPIITLLALVPLMAFGRPFQIIEPKKLIADSQLVFVGKVQSVKPSGIATSLSYPTWEGVSFPWLAVDVEVIAPFKGVRKGDVVHMMMLSIPKTEKAHDMRNPPSVLRPEKGDVFFLGLGPTPITNIFAALSGPYDENMSVIQLHRASRPSGYKQTVQFVLREKQFVPVWQLVDKSGEIIPDGVEKLRETYAVEIKTAPAKNIMYLEWQSYTNAHGWFSDVPKGFSTTNSGVKK